MESSREKIASEGYTGTAARVCLAVSGKDDWECDLEVYAGDAAADMDSAMASFAAWSSSAHEVADLVESAGFLDGADEVAVAVLEESYEGGGKTGGTIVSTRLYAAGELREALL